jgi:hypothetical protein
LRIKGIVAGEVEIKDIGIRLSYNQEKIITPAEYNRSRDLRTAIQKGWIQVLNRYSGNRMPKHISENRSDSDFGIDMDHVMKLATVMARKMADEMVDRITIKLNDQTNVLISENKETGSEIRNQPETGKSDSVHVEEETFVRMSSGNVGEDVDHHIDMDRESEKVIVNSDAVDFSLKKMRELRKRKNGDV